MSPELPAITVDELRDLKFCVGFDDKLLAAIAAKASRRKCRRGDVIIDDGARSTSVYLILRGEVRIEVTTPGGRQVLYDTLGTGETIGEMSAVDGLPRSARVTAAGALVLGCLTQRDFTALAHRSSVFAMAVARRICHTARWMSQRVQEFQGFHAKGRLCLELKRVTRCRKGAKINVTVTDLAARIGATRTSTSALMTKLVAAGVLRDEGSENGEQPRYSLLSPEKLCNAIRKAQLQGSR